MPSRVDLEELVIAQGLDLLTKGRRAYNHARMLVMVGGRSPEAEERARRALASMFSAMNWLEDLPHFEEAHAALHEAGAFTRSTFGCSLHFEDGRYEQRCPVALAHFRLGFSVGIVIREAHCSICKHDPEDCSHITGHVYDGRRCHRVITEAELLEVSVVSRPKSPDARMSSIPVSVKELQKSLGTNWRPGAPVTCSKCLHECDGFVHADKVLGPAADPHTEDARRLRM